MLQSMIAAYVCTLAPTYRSPSARVLNSSNLELVCNRIECKRAVVCCSSSNSKHVQLPVPGQPGGDDSSNPERRTAALDSNTEQAARQGEAVHLQPIPFDVEALVC
jgi:hypothetical protein